MEYRPGYAPELNPVEFIRGYWKQHALPNVCPKDYWSVNATARQTLKRMRRRPRLIRAFWQQAELPFECLYMMRDSIVLLLFDCRLPGRRVDPDGGGLRRGLGMRPDEASGFRWKAWLCLRQVSPISRWANSAPPALRPSPPRTLTATGKQPVLDVLHAERFRDQAPAEVFAPLRMRALTGAPCAPCAASSKTPARSASGGLTAPPYLPETSIAGHRPNQVWG